MAIGRRQFISILGGSAFAWSLAVRAQPGAIRRIGFLCLGNPDPAAFIKALRETLRDLGYSEGQNIQFEIRSAGGKETELAALAAQLVALKVSVLVAFQTPAATAAKQATTEIPIVIECADPVGQGFVASLSRPGGNITGLGAVTADIGPKNLEVIREFLPTARRVAVLANANDPFSEPFLEQIRLGAGQLNIEIKTVMVHSADDIDAEIADVVKWQPEALIVQPSLPEQQIASLALRYRLPAVSPTSGFGKLGGLASYSADLDALYRRCATYVDKILKGSDPSDLPVELPTKFWLAVNVKTAKALGIAVPQAILARADEVIE
jgi:putative ABC transport system substrate-binding protein